ncbi:MAG: LytTR family DNA-binding domain-containing protein [Pseudomonadota bacterium]
MNDSALQLTLRRLQSDFRQPVQWAVLIGVGLVLALSGAFETNTAMRPLPRVVYWIAIVVVTFAVGSFLTTLGQYWLAALNRWVRVAVLGTVNGLAVFAIVFGVNTAIFGPVYDTWAMLLGFLGTVIAITTLVTLVLDLAINQTQTAPDLTPDPAIDTAQTPRLLDRIAFDERGPLVSISVEDHYVRIRTTKGEAMVLMRLSDAMRETGPTQGLQVHRSHWVALDHVHSASRTSSGAVLTLSTGPDIPVSRSNLAPLKDLGLL